MKRFAAVLIALVLMLMCSTALAESDAYVTDFAADVVVRADGALEVRETLTYHVTDSINGFTRDIDPTLGTALSDFGAAYKYNMWEKEFTYDEGALKGDTGVYYATELDNGLVRCYMFLPCRDGDIVTLVYRYTLKGVCARYRDVGVLDAPLLGDAWEIDIENYELNLSFEEPVGGQIDVRVNNAGMRIESRETRGDTFRLTGTDAGEDGALRLRVMFPATALQGMGYTEDVDMRGEILAREAEYDLALEHNGRVGLTLGLALAALAVALGVLGGLKWGRGPRVPGWEYVSGGALPVRPGVSPAEIGLALARDQIGTNSLAATMLDLARRGYLAIEYSDDDMTYVRTGRPLDGCAPHERYALEWLLSLGDGQRVRLHEVKERAGTSQYYKDFSKWTEMVKSSASERDWYVKRSRAQIALGSSTLVLAMGTLAAGICCAAMGALFEAPAIGLIAGAVALLIAGVIVLAVYHRTEAGEQLAAEWRAVARWFKGDWAAGDLPADTALWEQLMVYALVLDVVKQLSSRLDSMDESYAYAMSRAQEAVLMRTPNDGGLNHAEMYSLYCTRTRCSMGSQSGSGGGGSHGSGAGGGGGGGTF